MSDLIKREDALAEFRDGRDVYDIMESIEELPSADRPTGEWKGYNADNSDWLRTDGTPIFLVCDKCHGVVLNNGSANWNFCPNCGAKMGGDDE